MAQIAVDFMLGRGWISRGIAWIGYGPNGYSHAANVIMDVYRGVPRERYLDSHGNVIAGVPAGVHIREIATEPFIRKRRATLEVSDDDYAYWETGLRAHMTTDYDRLAILGFLEGESLHTAGDWICSAYVGNGMQHLSRRWTAAGLVTETMRPTGFVRYPLSIPAHQISPNELMLILETAGFSLGPVQFQ